MHYVAYCVSLFVVRCALIVVRWSLSVACSCDCAMSVVYWCSLFAVGVALLLARVACWLLSLRFVVWCSRVCCLLPLMLVFVVGCFKCLWLLVDAFDVGRCSLCATC